MQHPWLPLSVNAIHWLVSVCNRTQGRTRWRAKEIIAGLTCYNFTLFALLLLLRSQSPFQCNYVIRVKDYKQIENCSLTQSSEVKPFQSWASEAYTWLSRGGRPEACKASHISALPAKAAQAAGPRFSCHICSSSRRESEVVFFPLQISILSVCVNFKKRWTEASSPKWVYLWVTEELQLGKHWQVRRDTGKVSFYVFINF